MARHFKVSGLVAHIGKHPNGQACPEKEYEWSVERFGFANRMSASNKFKQ